MLPKILFINKNLIFSGLCFCCGSMFIMFLYFKRVDFFRLI